jgi:serine/threonine protein kinase
MIHRLELPTGAVVAGDFKVLGPLAQGGMGSVYRVEQLSTGRQRALKVMHPGLLQDAVQRQRFAHEARASALADSPHMVDVVAAGVDEGSGIPWMAMELLPGETLSVVLSRRDTLPRAEVRGLFEQLGQALGSAHRAGVVHRDLKPDNLFLATARAPSEPFFLKVLDFGIAKVVLDSAAGNTAALGTPLWMAPEQATTGGLITPATDVWPLGLIAYQCLTGRHYWRAAEDPRAAGVGVLKEIVVDPLPQASARAGEQSRAGLLPLGFDAWFARCVCRDRAARFPHGAAAAEALVALLSDTAPYTSLPVGSPPPVLGLPWADTVSAEAAVRVSVKVSQPVVPPVAPVVAPGKVYRRD